MKRNQESIRWIRGVILCGLAALSIGALSLTGQQSRAEDLAEKGTVTGKFAEIVCGDMCWLVVEGKGQFMCGDACDDWFDRPPGAIITVVWARGMIETGEGMAEVPIVESITEK